MAQKRKTLAPKTQDCDLIIAGGGMAGLIAAYALAKQDFDVVVIDAVAPHHQTSVKHDGRTLSLTYGSKQAFDDLGLWASLASFACPIFDIWTSNDTSRAFVHFDHREMGSPLGFVIEHRYILSALHTAVQKQPRIKHLAPEKITRLTTSGTHASVTLASGETLTAPLVIAADGRSSFIRQAAGISCRTHDYHQTAIVTIARPEKPHENRAFERFLKSGPFAVLPMTDNRVTVVWAEKPDMIETIKSIDDNFFSELITDRLGPDLGKLSITGERWYYPLTLQHAERFYAPRVALLADAAHGIHPVAAQGFNLGLRDVTTLVDILKDARALGLDLGATFHLEQYERARRPDVLKTMAMTHGLTKIFSNDRIVPTILRRTSLRLLEKIPALKKRFIKKSMGIAG